MKIFLIKGSKTCIAGHSIPLFSSTLRSSSFICISLVLWTLSHPYLDSPFLGRPPWGPLPSWRLSCGFWASALSRLSSYLWAISSFPSSLLLLYPISNVGVVQSLTVAHWPLSLLPSFSFFTLSFWFSIFLTFPCILSFLPLTQVHSFPGFNYICIFLKFISSLNVRSLFPMVYWMFPLKCLMDTLNETYPKLNSWFSFPPNLIPFPIFSSQVNETPVR